MSNPKEEWFFSTTVVVTQIIVFLMVTWVFRHIITPGPYHNVLLQRGWFSALGSWDGGWYTNIAENGYFSLQTTAFFPLYPVLLAILHQVGIPIHLAEFLVSNIAFLIAVRYFYALAIERVGIDTAQKAAWLLSVFPGALFFNMAYTESLFLMLTVLFFYALHKDKWFLAIVVGYFAATTRDIGAVLFIPFLFTWWQHRKEYSNSVLRFLGMFAVPLGTITYMIYLGFTYRNAFAFVEAQKYWGRKPVVPFVQLLAQLVQSLFFVPVSNVKTANYAFLMFIDSSAAILFVVLAILYFFKRFRGMASIGERTYLWLSLLIVFASGTGGDAQSYARFASVLFPGYYIFAHLMKGRSTYIAMILVLFAFKVVLMGMFGDGYWVT